MQVWIAVLIWIADVAVLSFCLAIFEILLEKQHGWAGTLNPSGWGKRIFAETFVAEICEKPYLTLYHPFMFAFVVPGILYGQLWISKHLLSASRLSLLIKASDGTLSSFLFLASIWFSILVVEDALWFVLNWYYPESWSDLLRGQIWWHTRWVTIGSIKLPRFYLITPLVAVALLAISLSTR